MGYAALALVLLRLFHGLLGPTKARFIRFVAGPRQTLSYISKLMQGREPRYLVHNPLGSWMVVALLTAIFATGITGWLFTTDRFWGVEWMLNLHAWLADILLALITIHIAGVVFMSVRHGENLAVAMVHGRKPLTTRRHPEEALNP